MGHRCLPIYFKRSSPPIRGAARRSPERSMTYLFGLLSNFRDGTPTSLAAPQPRLSLFSCTHHVGSLADTDLGALLSPSLLPPPLSIDLCARCGWSAIVVGWRGQRWQQQRRRTPSLLSVVVVIATVATPCIYLSVELTSDLAGFGSVASLTSLTLHKVRIYLLTYVIVI